MIKYLAPFTGNKVHIYMFWLNDCFTTIANYGWQVNDNAEIKFNYLCWCRCKIVNVCQLLLRASTIIIVLWAEDAGEFIYIII
jgi:hypothetical protein